MKSDLKVCPHCSHNFEVCVSDDVAFLAHWVGEYYLIDVCLLFDFSSKMLVLYREVYVAESEKKRVGVLS